MNPAQASTASSKCAPQRLMAFDYGLKRTGVATGNSLTGTSQAHKSLKGNPQSNLQQALACIQEWQPDALVVGVPLHPDGKPHENTVRARRFANELRRLTGLTVFEVDERYSTVEAIAQGATDHDAAAACIILEQHLRSLAQ